MSCRGRDDERDDDVGYVDSPEVVQFDVSDVRPQASVQRLDDAAPGAADLRLRDHYDDPEWHGAAGGGGGW